ncbi:DNA-binding domain superfamily [Sesbania bispinosa]|nr:DNA-binding domain superfamily [Sesbania bispinosa]
MAKKSQEEHLFFFSSTANTRKRTRKSTPKRLTSATKLIYRGVTRHHHNGRWEARIGRVFGNKYLYLGTYATQEEAATAYDMAAIEYRGLNAVTNFDLSRYVNWLRPKAQENNQELNLNSELELGPSPTIGEMTPPSATTTPSALGLLLQSSKFKEMLEKTTTSSSSSPTDPAPAESSTPPRRTFPEDIQTIFECQDSGIYAENDHDIILVT